MLTRRHGVGSFPETYDVLPVCSPVLLFKTGRIGDPARVVVFELADGLNWQTGKWQGADLHRTGLQQGGFK